MRSDRVWRYRAPDGSETVIVRRTSVIAALLQIGCWCLAVAWPLVIWHGFAGGIAEGAWLTVAALIGWANHRLRQLSDEGNDHASGHPAS